MTDEVHVVFGTGTIGLELVDELDSQGYRVRAVNRSGVASIPAGVELMAGDVLREGFATTAAAGASVVYQCLNPPYHKWPELFPAMQQATVDAARATGARFVSFENVYAYGDTAGRPISEDLPYLADTKKGKVRAAMAESLATLHELGDLEVVTARASDYFGPGATDQSQLGARFIGRAIAGKSMQVVGDPDQPHSYTYSRDIARTLVTLGGDPRAGGHVWHVPNAPARTTREIAAMVADQLGSEVRVAAAPQAMLRVMGLFNPTVRELNEMLYEFEQPFVVDSSKFEAAYGAKATPLEESLAATVEWWLAQA